MLTPNEALTIRVVHGRMTRGRVSGELPAKATEKEASLSRLKVGR